MIFNVKQLINQVTYLIAILYVNAVVSRTFMYSKVQTF